MKPISCEIENFASYSQLSFNFQGNGLALIQGANGSGKSTLCDIIPWTLFGRTAKNGAVDEILSWPGDKITKCTLKCTVDYGSVLYITRIRGGKANDLYFEYNNGTVIRGKDLTDTQRLLNKALGMDCDLYLAASYYHEFSQTANFFITNAKNRRILCEQLTDLSFAKNTQLKLSSKQKDVKKALQETVTQIAAIEREATFIKAQKPANKDFIQAKQKELKDTRAQLIPPSGIEELTANIQAVKSHQHTDKCATCGAPNQDAATLLQELKSELQTSLHKNQMLDQRCRHIKSQIDIEIAKDKTFKTQTKSTGKELEAAQTRAAILNQELNDLDTLLEALEYSRSAAIAGCISILELSTNKLLSDHFDAEIKVLFEVQDKDKLEVTLFKDGNLCSFSQLSKGQRQMLRLCFALSVMKHVSNQNGLNVSTIFLDEAFDGLSETSKEKAFYLLKALEPDYDSIYVVDHSEGLKVMFDKAYTVSLSPVGSVVND